MPEQQVILSIDEEGKITAKTHGFKGEACLDAVEELFDQELNIISVKKTDEYFQKNEEVQNRQVYAKRGDQ